MLHFFGGQFENRALTQSNLLGQLGEFLIEFDVFGQNARAVFAPALDIFAERFAAARCLLELLIKAGRGGAFSAMTLFDLGQIRAEMGVFFVGALGFRLGGVELFAQGFEGQFALGAFGFFLFGDGDVAGAGFVGALFFALQAFEFETGNRHARVGAVNFLGGASQIMIERDCFLFTRLLELAQAFELDRQGGHLAVQVFQFGRTGGEEALALDGACRHRRGVRASGRGGHSTVCVHR